jgi:hypothetical protein
MKTTLKLENGDTLRLDSTEFSGKLPAEGEVITLRDLATDPISQPHERSYRVKRVESAVVILEDLDDMKARKTDWRVAAKRAADIRRDADQKRLAQQPDGISAVALADSRESEKAMRAASPDGIDRGAAKSLSESKTRVSQRRADEASARTTRSRSKTLSRTARTVGKRSK